MSNTQSQKVNAVIDAYLDKLLEPQIIADASLPQLTKTIEILLTKYAAGNPVPKPQDPLSQSLQALAERMNDGDIS